MATLDQRYWERQTEINRDKKSASASTSNNKPTSSDKSSASQQSSSGNKQDNRQQQGKKDQKKPASSSTPTTPSSSDKNSIANLLGLDGKLKPEERQRRMDNKLCLRCGKPGHTVNDCPTKSKTKVEQPLPPLLLHPQPLAAREKGEQPFDITARGLR